MNDRDPLDPVDRLLSDAFRSRPVPPMSRPSVIDVQHRARRRQRRRSGAMLGAIAVMGVGGTVALASRGNDGDRIALSPGDGHGADGGVATTVACSTLPGPTTTSMPPTTIGFIGTTTTNAVNTYVVVAGDTPSIVAQKFDVSLDDLNSANSVTEGYDAFFVGLQIVIPGNSIVATTVPATLPSDPCAPTSGGSYHCTGPLGTDGDGAQMFIDCSFWPDYVPTTTYVVPPVTMPGTAVIDETTTTSMYTECPPNASCAIDVASTTTMIESPPVTAVPCDFPPATSPVTTICADGVQRLPLILPTTSSVAPGGDPTSTTSLP